jgi:hypothetical protein
VRHPGDAQLLTKGAPEARSGATDGLEKLNAVSLAVGLAHGRHVGGVPVDADEARGEELVAELILAGRGDGVVQEECIADGAVDDAVEDVGEELALRGGQYTYENKTTAGG